MTTTPRLWKSQTQVNTTDATAPQNEGQIAALLGGGYVVAWTDKIGTIIGQRYDTAGSTIGGEVKLNFPGSSSDTGDADSPAVTRLSNGNIAVAFVNFFAGFQHIWVTVVNPSLGEVRNDAIETGFPQTVRPSITALAGGGYAVSYTLENSASDTDIVAHIVSPAGMVSGPITVGADTDNQDFSQVTTLANGNFVVVYQDEFLGNPSNIDIKFAIFSPTGTLLSGPAAVGGALGFGMETRPDVAALRDGGFVVVWTDADSTTTDIRATIFNSVGGLVAFDILVNTSTTGAQEQANVVALSDGGFLVTWEDDNAALVRAQRLDAAGHKIGTEFTVKNGVSVNSPQAAQLVDGRIAYAIDDFSTGDWDVATSIWTTDLGALATGAVSAAGDFNSNGTQDYTSRDASAVMTMWQYDTTAQQVTQADLGTVDFGWNILASDHFSNASADQMLTRHLASGTMTLWWLANGQLAGANIGQRWNGVDYVATGQFTDAGGAGIANFLVTNVGDHHLYNWWIDSNYTLQGIDLGAVWSNKSLVGTGAFTPNGGTDFLVANAGDHHLYDWWIDPTSHTLQGYDLGAYWNNVGYIASGKFSANGGGNDNFLVFNVGDRHLYNWWIDPVSHTLQGLDLGAAWNNIELLASGHFSDHTSYEQFLVRNTVDNHLYEWWITPQHTLGGIDLGPAWSSSLQIIDSGNLNGSTTNDEWLVRNAADGHFYQWFISNNQLAGVDLGVPFIV